MMLPDQKQQGRRGISCDVVLIRPELSEIDKSVTAEEPCYEHLGLAYCASSLRNAGMRVKMLDAAVMRLSRKEVVERTIAADPLLVGITVSFEFGMESAGALADSLRQRSDCHIVLGGHYPTADAVTILGNWPAVSSVVRHEGEVTLVELARTLRNGERLEKVEGLTFRQERGVVCNPDRAEVLDIGVLPYPARDMLPFTLKASPVASILSSRGCYGSCTFCSIHGFYENGGKSRWRYRPVGDIVNEMAAVSSRYGCSRFLFLDDMFIPGGNVGLSRARAFSKALNESDLGVSFSISCRPDQISRESFSLLKSCGLRSVFLGAESGSDAMLARLRKGFTVDCIEKALSILGSLDIGVTLGFILFDRDSTMDEVGKSLAFLQAHAGEYIRVHPFSRLIPYIGSEAHRQYKLDGSLSDRHLMVQYRFRDPDVERFYRLGNRFFLHWFDLLERKRRDVELGIANAHTPFDLWPSYRELVHEINMACVSYLMRMFDIACDSKASGSVLEAMERSFREQVREWYQVLDLIVVSESENSFNA